MPDALAKALLYLKDYAETGRDRYFLFSDGTIVEVSAHQVVAETELLVCHDYWLIAPALLRHTGKLPALVVDLDEFQVMISGSKQECRLRDKRDISRRTKFFEIEQEICRNYFAMFYRSVPFDVTTFEQFGAALSRCWSTLELAAQEHGELERFRLIEQPASRYLVASAARGISIDVDRLREHKRNLEHEYFTALKTFSARYRVPLEVPDDLDVIAYLEPRGFDFNGVDVDYILKFVPMQDSFATDLLHLRKLDQSRRVLTALPLSKNRIYPLVDIFGSITSRIYFKDPSLQNLAKRHRNIIRPDAGRHFCYVDYDQYEAGIMAALSGDPQLLALYSDGDIYEAFAARLFGDIGERKRAKRLFLSYAYGMSMRSLIDAAVGYGADRIAAKSLFKGFSVFESWKASIWETFTNDGRVGTSLGNFLNRERDGPLTGQEQRSAVSQVVQGTASLIFKKALLALANVSEVEMKLPMHDAVLVQVPPGYDVNVLPRLLGNVMSAHFDGRIVGKASIESFCKA